MVGKITENYFFPTLSVTRIDGGACILDIRTNPVRLATYGDHEKAQQFFRNINRHDTENCQDCGSVVVFESTPTLPGVREYDVCSDCAKHICPDCTVIVGESPFCKECRPNG